MPLPTGDLEAAFQATGAADITAYGAVPAGPAAGDPPAPDPAPPAYRSFGWARATGPDGATAAAWLQAGESYAFTAAASIRAVEEDSRPEPYTEHSAPPRRSAPTSP